MGLFENFEDDRHALATGLILGTLIKGSQDDTMLKVLEPVLDEDGNYTNTIRVEAYGDMYYLTVDVDG